MKDIINVNFSYKRVLFLLAVCSIAVSCNRTTKEIKETYADGKAKKVDEYTTDDKGNKVLYKETFFFPGEKKYISGTYNNAQNRNGVWTSWYENGQKNSEQNYIDGKEDGKYRVWYPNGNPYIQGEYKMGMKIGMWSFHDTLGDVIKEVDFDKK
ncbi:MAG: hypothetical protein LBI60_07335 [Bacteroidales bacterium]|nr:hypothetical protein [Bacteroidales bacterium]